MTSRAAVAVMRVVPVPMAVARWVMLRDNVQENADSWDRLRAPTESARYAAVRAVTERYAADGFVLDIGCSQGILAEGLRYRRYLGVDAHAPAITIAAAKTDHRTTFAVGDAVTFTPPTPPDAVVINEVIYYLPHPAAVVERYTELVGSDGVVVVSIFAHSWAARRLLRRLDRRLSPVEQSVAGSGHLAWAIAVYRRRADPGRSTG